MMEYQRTYGSHDLEYSNFLKQTFKSNEVF